MKQQRKSKRMQQRFWLDAFKPDESDLLERLDSLKKTRQYSATIRDALTLLFSLQDGRVDVLQAMYPDLIEVLHNEGRDQERDRMQAAHDEKLEQLTRIIEKLDKPPSPGNGGPVGNPKQLTGLKPVMPPTPDDDSGLIEIRNDTSTESAANFLRSAFALQQ